MHGIVKIYFNEIKISEEKQKKKKKRKKKKKKKIEKPSEGFVTKILITIDLYEQFEGEKSML